MNFPRVYLFGQRIQFNASALPVRCRGCGEVHCNCPDPVWNGNVPPRGAA